MSNALDQARYERQHRRPEALAADERGHQRDSRSEGERDRDRVLYTSAFRRLAGVTQVVSPSEGHVFHNRLTHTLEVAQIGRRLAERIRDQYRAELLASAGGLDPDVVEAAALVHDLGHPPFGHVTESELKRLLSAHYPELSGSFEGNAQSFRIVTKLAVHRANRANPAENYSGINLTRATLNAVLKYPWQRSADSTTKQHEKWGVYESEASEFDWARTGFPPQTNARTLEADLMDWADDVAYSVHDLEDFYRAGLIPLDRLGAKADAERNLFWERRRRRHETGKEKLPQEGDDRERADEEFRRLERAFDPLMELIGTFIDEPFDDSRAHRGYLRGMTSFFVDRYINALTVLSEPDATGSWVQRDTQLHREVKLLKALTWEYVIDGPALASQQQGQRRIIRTLFLTFARATRKPDTWKMFPRPYQEELERTKKNPGEHEIRVVLDFIASMTEQQALRVYQRVTGHAPGSVLGPY